MLTEGFGETVLEGTKTLPQTVLGVPYPSHPSSPKNQCSQELHVCFYSKGRPRRTLAPCWPCCDLGHMPSHVQAQICSPGMFSVAPLPRCGEGWCGTECFLPREHCCLPAAAAVPLSPTGHLGHGAPWHRWSDRKRLNEARFPPPAVPVSKKKCEARAH